MDVLKTNFWRLVSKIQAKIEFLAHIENISIFGQIFGTSTIWFIIFQQNFRVFNKKFQISVFTKILIFDQMFDAWLEFSKKCLQD